MPGYGSGPYGAGPYGGGFIVTPPGMGEHVAPPSWTLRARNAARVEGDLVDEWTSLVLVERWPEPDTLQVTGPRAVVEPLWGPGAGVTLWSDTRRFTGVCWSLDKSYEAASLTLMADTVTIWDADVYPDPVNALSAQTTAYYTLSGTVEDVLLDLINKNVGPGALVARRKPGLAAMPTSLGRGGTITGKARLDNLGRLVADICEASGLRVTVQQVGTGLAVVVAEAPDLTDTVRYGTPETGGPGLLGSDWRVTKGRPRMTVANVLGAGEGVARVMNSVTGSQATTWGRIEDSLDRTNLTTLTELGAEGAAELLLTGESREVSTATVEDDPDQPLADVPMGALVRLDLPGEPAIFERLRQRTTTVGGDGATVKVTGQVGRGDPSRSRAEAELAVVKRSLRRVITR